MKKLALVVMLSAALFGALAVPALSQTGGTVDVTVSPQVSISVSINQTQIDYDTVPLSISNTDRRMSNISPEIVVRNTGNVPIDLLIRGSDASPAQGAAWELSCSPSPGSVAADQYVHRFWLSSQNQTDAQSLCSDSDLPLAADVPPWTSEANDVKFLLRLSMPTGTSVFGPHNSTVTITAVQ